jgi:hypothetical protein
MSEIWKSCEFDNRYKISNFGNIKRILANGSERILKPSILNKGRTHPYYYIQLKKEGKRKNYLIHRLVCFAFCEGHSDKNNICDHIDRNTFNNHYTNLRWGSQKDNMKNTKIYRHDIPEENHLKIINKLHRKKTIDEKKYYCSLCNIICQAPKHLEIHNLGYRHQLKKKFVDETGIEFNLKDYKKWRSKRYDKQKKTKISVRNDVDFVPNRILRPKDPKN